METKNKYQRKINKVEVIDGFKHSSSVCVDVYDILQAWNVTNPAIQHAIKKLLQPGARGHKSKVQDLEEAMASIKRAIELEAE